MLFMYPFARWRPTIFIDKEEHRANMHGLRPLIGWKM